MNNEQLLSLLIDLHLDGERQGPGSEAETLKALAHTQLDTLSPLKVADIGCGSGASTVVLAKNLPNAHITAVDLFPEFLHVLTKKSQQMGLVEQIKATQASMDALPFSEESLDLIWSEGAIYNIGFKKGVEAWKPFLKAGGVLAVSEITWLHPKPPEEIRTHWQAQYPEISTAPEKITLLENAGYDLLGYSVLPPSNWIENYYLPTEARIAKFSARHKGVEEAQTLIAMERHEAKLYREYQDWFSYGFYVARKR